MMPKKSLVYLYVIADNLKQYVQIARQGYEIGLILHNVLQIKAYKHLHELFVIFWLK